MYFLIFIFYTITQLILSYIHFFCLFYSGVHPQDIAEMMQLMGMIQPWKRDADEGGCGLAVIVDWPLVDSYLERIKTKPRIKIDPEALRWTPLISNYVNPFKIQVL